MVAGRTKHHRPCSISSSFLLVQLARSTSYHLAFKSLDSIHKAAPRGTYPCRAHARHRPDISRHTTNQGTLHAWSN